MSPIASRVFPAYAFSPAGKRLGINEQGGMAGEDCNG